MALNVLQLFLSLSSPTPSTFIKSDKTLAAFLSRPLLLVQLLPTQHKPKTAFGKHPNGSSPHRKTLLVLPEALRALNHRRSVIERWERRNPFQRAAASRSVIS